MDDQQALAIVSALANGANPITGEIFAANSPYQSPDVIRALFVAQRALESRALRLAAASSQTRGLPEVLERPPASVDLTPVAGEETRLERSRSDRTRSENPKPEKANAGKPWSDQEDKQLLAEFDADQPLVHIARLHGRTVNGVRARLEKHGRLPPSEATRWPKDSTQQSSLSRQP